MNFKNFIFFIISSVLNLVILGQECHPPLDFKMLLLHDTSGLNDLNELSELRGGERGRGRERGGGREREREREKDKK